MKHLISFLRDRRGATAIEYSLMIALIAIVIVAAVTTAGTKTSKQFSFVASKLN